MAYCSECGTQVPAAAAFCGACGKPVFDVASASEQITMQSVTPQLSWDEAAKTFVGKNNEYFIKKWDIAEQRGSKPSWNWAAFFLGFMWMAYRKMYVYSWIFIGAVVVGALLEYAFGFSGKISNAINIAIACIFGLQGNYWYKLHVKRKVAEITATSRPEQTKVELARQGGTSFGAAVGFLIALVVILGLVIIAAGPQA